MSAEAIRKGQVAASGTVDERGRQDAEPGSRRGDDGEGEEALAARLEDGVPRGMDGGGGEDQECEVDLQGHGGYGRGRLSIHQTHHGMTLNQKVRSFVGHVTLR